MGHSVDIGAPAPAKEDRETEPPPSRTLALDLVEEGGDWTTAGDLEPLLARIGATLAGSQALAGVLPPSSAACVAFADDAAVRDLNLRYRMKDGATNVLSFPAGTTPDVEGEPRFLGDVILAAETVMGEAAAQGIPVPDHVSHLVVHGVLHLLGFDHQDDAEALVMEQLEQSVLATLGVPNPYRDSE